MKISKYLWCLIKDFFVTCGCLMVIVATFLTIYKTETINTSLFWQITLVASAYTFFKFALVNKYELGKRAQMLSFFICFLLADIMVILWLCFFSPSKIVDMNLIIAYIIVVLIVKGLVYAMIYMDSHEQAKKLNEKLSKYNGDGNK